jgi:hypothetical protein
MAKNTHTTEESLEAVFSMQSVTRLYNKDQKDKQVRVVREKNMVTGPTGPKIKNDCASEDWQQITRPGESVMNGELAHIVGG